MKISHTLSYIVLLGTISGVYPQADDGCKVTSELDGMQFADNLFANNFKSQLIYPAGQHYNNVTYVCYQGPAEGSYVAAYNHTSKSWLGPVKVLDNPMGSKSPGENNMTDNHGAPHMAISNDGYINIFGGGHGGCDTYHEGTVWVGENPHGEGCKYPKSFNKKKNPSYNGVEKDPSHIGVQRHVRSSKPENIFDWETPKSNLSPFASYGGNLIMQNGSDELYVIVRHGPHTADWTYQKSVNGGKTFESAVPFFKYKKVNRKLYETWYVRCFVAKENAEKKRDIIGCFATWHYHSLELYPGHGPDRRNIYYIEIDTKDGKIHNVHGKELEIPVTLEEADSHALVFESNRTFGVYAMPLDGKFNINGDPEVLVDVSDSKEIHHVMYIKYTEKQGWNVPTSIAPIAPIVNFTYMARFTNKDQQVSNVVREVSGRMLFFASNQTSNSGYPWMLDEDESKCFVGTDKLMFEHIRNPHKNAQFLMTAGTKRSNKYYAPVYLIGDDGIVSRDADTSTDLWQQCYDATDNDECFVPCLEGKQLLKIELFPETGVKKIRFISLFQKNENNKYIRVWKETNIKTKFNLSSHLSLQRCIPTNMKTLINIKLKRKNQSKNISNSNNGGGYKLTLGGNAIEENTFPESRARVRFSS